MSRVVALLNPAGSSAKSTTAAALCAVAAAAGRRVLAVDLDPQANLTGWLGGSSDTAGITQAIRAAVANHPDAWPGVSAEEVRADLRRHVQRTIQPASVEGVQLIAADPGVRALLRSWGDLREEGADQLLAEALAPLADQFDLIVLDCKGDLGALSEAALRAADEVIGVATPTLKSLEGLTVLRAEASSVGARFRTVIPVRVRHRNAGAEQADLAELMAEQWAEEVTPPIRGGVGLDAAYAAGRPITVAEPRSRISEDVRAVYGVLVDRGVL